jgi:hypothetical protein
MTGSIQRLSKLKGGRSGSGPHAGCDPSRAGPGRAGQLAQRLPALVGQCSARSAEEALQSLKVGNPGLPDK